MLLGTNTADAGDLLLLLSAADHDVPFTLPEDVPGSWRLCIDTWEVEESEGAANQLSALLCRPRSLMLLERL
jgi:hypothetical protein